LILDYFVILTFNYVINYVIIPFWLLYTLIVRYLDTLIDERHIY